MSDAAKSRTEARTKPIEAETEARPVESETKETTEIRREAEEGFHALETLTRRVIEQSRAAMQLGLSTFAHAQAPMAESSYSQSRKAIEAAAKISDCYREAAEQTTNDVQVLNACALQLFRGGQQMQHAWFDAMQRSLDQMGHKPQMLFNARSPLEAAQLQRDIYGDFVSSFVRSATTMLQLMAETSQEALRPLQQRGRT